jgi:hypothetical protein
MTASRSLRGLAAVHGRTRWRRDVDAQFLSKLSSKCRARQFAGLHVPTGQVPDVGIPTTPGSSVTEQYPVAVAQQRRAERWPAY